jgi:hypothetical protein
MKYSGKYIIELAEGETGSIKVMGELLKQYGEISIDLLKNAGIRGRNIWLVFKYLCYEDISCLFKKVALGDAKEWLSQNGYLE